MMGGAPRARTGNLQAGLVLLRLVLTWAVKLKLGENLNMTLMLEQRTRT